MRSPLWVPSVPYDRKCTRGALSLSTTRVKPSCGNALRTSLVVSSPLRWPHPLAAVATATAVTRARQSRHLLTRAAPLLVHQRHYAQAFPSSFERHSCTLTHAAVWHGCA